MHFENLWNGYWNFFTCHNSYMCLYYLGCMTSDGGSLWRLLIYFKVNTRRQFTTNATKLICSVSLLIWCSMFWFFFPWPCSGGLILLYWPDVYDDSTVPRLWRSRCCLSLHGPVWWVLHLHYGSYCLWTCWGSGCLPGHRISTRIHVNTYDSGSTHCR